MDFIELINKRFSVRAYKSDPIDQDKLSIILNAARLAPTAGNRQPFQIIVIKTDDREEDLLKIYPRDWFVKAPIIICLCGNPEICWTRSDNRKYLDVDIALVMDYIILAATEMGLGTCFVAAFDPIAARQVLSIPENIEPILFTPLGYIDDLPKVRERKSLDELVRYEHW